MTGNRSHHRGHDTKAIIVTRVIIIVSNYSNHTEPRNHSNLYSPRKQEQFVTTVSRNQPPTRSVKKLDSAAPYSGNQQEKTGTETGQRLVQL